MDNKQNKKLPYESPEIEVVEIDINDSLLVTSGVNEFGDSDDLTSEGYSWFK